MSLRQAFRALEVGSASYEVRSETDSLPTGTSVPVEVPSPVNFCLSMTSFSQGLPRSMKSCPDVTSIPHGVRSRQEFCVA